MTKISISRAVYEKIKENVLNTSDRYEIGGVLLGHKTEQLCRVTEITLPRSTEAENNYSFKLDGCWHTMQVERILHHCNPALEILGIWHSHTCGIKTFSHQDRLSHFRFAKSNAGAISLLVYLADEKQKIGMICDEVKASGEINHCLVEIGAM